MYTHIVGTCFSGKMCFEMLTCSFRTFTECKDTRMEKLYCVVFIQIDLFEMLFLHAFHSYFLNMNLT